LTGFRQRAGPAAHATAQGMRISYKLKYRYPEWIEQNYK
jgi:hypothetical protein